MHRIASDAFDNKDWGQVMKIAKEARESFSSPPKCKTMEFCQLMIMGMDAQENDWKIKDIDFSLKSDTDQENEIIISVMRKEIERYGKAIKPDWTFYIGYSRLGDKSLDDPDEKIFQAISDLPWKFRPISKAKRSTKGVFDTETDNYGSTVEVCIIGWCDDSTAKIKFDSFTAGLAAYGYFATIRKQTGKWVLGKEEMEWCS